MNRIKELGPQIHNLNYKLNIVIYYFYSVYNLEKAKI